MDYQELLDRAYEKLPKTENSEERFEIPKVEIINEGNKTIITNFIKLTQIIRRDPKHLFKYLVKTLAAPGVIEGQRLVLNTRLTRKKIQEKFESYVKTYVICKECGKPDTKLIKEGRITLMKCEACGAKSNV
ncbi:MAG: translation initiation factor IF-2 subunit beta [Candidatus Aenigmarchaeota archaeon]|nr:translation initiation factor IF-2 subunit beta [Candidatus Aenigmarchaeota archaeon]